MHRSLAGALAALAVVLGCTHRARLSGDAAELSVGQRVTARTVAGDQVEGAIVKGPLGGYRVRLHDPRRELELGELRTISRESAARGALDGLLIGGAVGLVAGAVLGLATYDGSGYIVHNRGEATMLGAALLGGIGGLVGAAGGAAGGATLEYAVPAR
ncbi:MAG TPA: hypothetical protein VFU21_22610 [Kofleriaceae bacterium]|nr:hypothetical protein [Kofleriaceae bacterium]